MLVVRNVTLPGVGTYSVYAGRTPDDLLELVSVRRKEMYNAILSTGRGCLPQCTLGYTHPWTDTGGGVCLPQCMLGYTLPGQTSPLGRHQPGQTPPRHTPLIGRHTLGRHPPRQAPPFADTPWADTPIGRNPPRQTPPQADTPWANTPRQTPLPPVITVEDTMHHTGMHSCWENNVLNKLHFLLQPIVKQTRPIAQIFLNFMQYLENLAKLYFSPPPPSPTAGSPYYGKSWIRPSQVTCYVKCHLL